MVIDTMKSNLFWYFFLLLLLLTAGYDIYNSFFNISLQTIQPVWLSYLTVTFDTLTIGACLGIIYKRYILHHIIWLLIIYAQITAVLLTLYYEFTAGGYTTNEMLLFSNIIFFVALIFLYPLIKYYQLVKKHSKQCNSELGA